MSILIKGMEMPRNCYGCPFFKQVDYWNKNDEADILSKCERTGEFTWESVNGYLQDCPLVPVPTPHGRLGDLDEFAKVVLNWITTQEKAYPNEDSNALSWRLGARAMGHQIYRDIEAAPTIIPAEEGE